MYLYGVLYFTFTDVRTVYIDFSPVYLISTMMISNCITKQLIELF